jgi:ubiquinol-cytochrome c reductase subunit 6
MVKYAKRVGLSSQIRSVARDIVRVQVTVKRYETKTCTTRVNEDDPRFYDAHGNLSACDRKEKPFTTRVNEDDPRFYDAHGNLSACDRKGKPFHLDINWDAQRVTCDRKGKPFHLDINWDAQRVTSDHPSRHQVCFVRYSNKMSDEEPVDPMAAIRKECTPTCPKQIANYEACKDRIRDKSGVSCDIWYYELHHCVDKCVAPKIFAVTKE